MQKALKPPMNADERRSFVPAFNRSREPSALIGVYRRWRFNA
jgi:hypothetical protein